MFYKKEDKNLPVYAKLILSIREVIKLSRSKTQNNLSYIFLESKNILEFNTKSNMLQNRTQTHLNNFKDRLNTDAYINEHPFQIQVVLKQCKKVNGKKFEEVFINNIYLNYIKLFQVNQYPCLYTKNNFLAYGASSYFWPYYIGHCTLHSGSTHCHTELGQRTFLSIRNGIKNLFSTILS